MDFWDASLKSDQQHVDEWRQGFTHFCADEAFFPTQHAPQRPGRAGCVASCPVDPLILLMTCWFTGTERVRPRIYRIMEGKATSGHISQLMRWWRGSNGLETLILYLKVLKLSLKGLNCSLKPYLSAYWIIFNSEDQDKALTTVAEQILL